MVKFKSFPIRCQMLSQFYLHSNMVKFKCFFHSFYPLCGNNLHSNMVKFKWEFLRKKRRAAVIYIPIWLNSNGIYKADAIMGAMFIYIPIWLNSNYFAHLTIYFL